MEPEKDLAVLKMLPKDGSALPPPIAVGASDGLSVGQALRVGLEGMGRYEKV